MISLAIKGGVAGERAAIQEAFIILNNSPIEHGHYNIFLKEDVNITPDDFYIGDALHPLTQNNYTKPVRLGRLVNDVIKISNRKNHSSNLQDIPLGSLTLNQKKLLLIETNGLIEAYLTEKEMAILLCLNKEKTPVMRQELLDKVWGYADNVETHTLETHLYRLRQKIENTFGCNDFIIMRDGGYVLNS